MQNKMTYLPITELRAPKVALRPVRKTSVEFMELVESIKTDGVLQPLLVRSIEGAYEIVEGEHRREASKVACRDTVPVMIKDMSDDEALIIQLKANAVRPLETQNYEYARRLRKLLDDGLSLAELSNKVDKSPVWIKKMLKLNGLCDAAIKPVNNGDIKLRAAMALATLPPELQPQFIEDAKTMKADFFVCRTREARSDYEAFLLKQTEREQAAGLDPKMRHITDIGRELDEFRFAERVLEAVEAKTPMDGYKAALAWMLKLDPVSVGNRLKHISEGRRDKLNAHDKRKLRRKIVETLTHDSLKPGDQTNGE